MDTIYRHFENGFERAVTEGSDERRIGAELKFPLVDEKGAAAPYEKVEALWDYLQDCGWFADADSLSGRVVGARTKGERNDTVASCETGYCKVEFSLAHVADIFALDDAVGKLRSLLESYCREHKLHMLGCGIHPVSSPHKRLLMKKGRTGVWDKVFGANRVLPLEDGDDMCLFTVNAASHVHLSTTPDEAITAVNALNGFAAAQLALTANSKVWRNRIDDQYCCVAEKLWDWWMPEGDRIGVPPRAFADLRDYVQTIASFRPVYVKRDGKPIVLRDYSSFGDYYGQDSAEGIDADGEPVRIKPESADIDLHNSCYWFNARLSRYYTLENRTNDQQPPEDIACIAALTAGLVTALDRCGEVLKQYDWSLLRQARQEACRHALPGRVNGLALTDLAGQMLEVADEGLSRRGLGEQQFLEPLHKRLADKRCPADEAADLFAEGGVGSLIENRKFC